MKVSIFTSWKTKCGIADYSRFLSNALARNNVAVETVPVRDKKTAALFIKDGKRLNAGDVAHIQHEYSFFTNSQTPVLSPLLSLWHFYLLLSQVKVPRIVTLHELQASHAVNPLLSFLRYLFLKLFAVLLRRCDLIIVHTERFRELLIRHGVDSQRVAFLPHPYPVSKLPSHDEGISTDEFKRSLSINDKTIATIFGFVYARKGYEVAIPAIRDLQGCTLLIAGGPLPGDTSGYYDTLVARIAELNLSEKVKILGFLPESELHAVLSATDIFLAPFLDASGSGSLSRIAVYQKPIIASDIPPMVELQKIGLGIELFESGNSDDLRNTVMKLLGDEERRRHLAALTSQFIDRYSYDSFATVLKSIYMQKAVHYQTR